MALTEEHLADWDKSGKAFAVAALGGGDADAKAMIYECLKAATLEKLPAEKLVELVGEAGCATAMEDFASMLSDAFWMLHLVCENQPDPTCAPLPPADSSTLLARPASCMGTPTDPPLCATARPRRFWPAWSRRPSAATG
jgi:hypothetical protein